jgi:uncharacterized protein YjeT (DUF2065 family)
MVDDITAGIISCVVICVGICFVICPATISKGLKPLVSIRPAIVRLFGICNVFMASKILYHLLVDLQIL